MNNKLHEPPPEEPIELNETLLHLKNDAENYIKQNPLKVIAFSLITGALLAKILWPRTRK